MFDPRCMIGSVLVLLTVAVALLPSGLLAAETEMLAFEQRLEGHRAIEQVYWELRIWPKANPEPKPAFETMMPEAALRAKVDDSLRLSSALREFWRRPITTEDLQAEIDRMIRGTTWPTVLEQLFGVLDNDPELIAECFARPLLAERLARRLYADDLRIHGDLEDLVRSEVAEVASAELMGRLSGRYSEREWVRYGVEKSERELRAEEGAGARLMLDPVAWERLVNELDADLCGARIGEVSPVKETAEAYSVTALLERSGERLRVATMVWQKRDFDQWWIEHRSGFSAEVEEEIGEIELRPIDSEKLLGNSWVDTDVLGAPSARAYHTATWTGLEMVVWGGQVSQGVSYSGSRYFPASDAWVPMTSTGHPSARALHSAVWTGSYVAVWGGWYGGFRDDGGRYYAATNTWYTMASASGPSARAEHTATWTGTYMAVFGGWNGSDYLGVGARWTDNYWSNMSTTDAPGARIGHVAVYCEDTDGPIVIWGGESAGGFWGSGREYDANANTWHPIPATSLTPRSRHSGVYMSSHLPSSPYHGQQRVVFLGGNTTAGTTTTGAGYDPITNQWSSIVAPTIEARQGHTAIANKWTMLMWGGFSSSTYYKTGGIYNPVNDDWEWTFTISAPSARRAHTAIWRPQAGTSDRAGEMIIWGGQEDAGFSDEGGRYTPVSDILLAANQDEFVAVPGGTETAAVTAHLFSLSGFSGSVDLSCEPSYYVTCSFEEDPATVTANGINFIDVTFYAPSGAITVDYPIQITANNGQDRSYPLTMKVQDFDVSCAQSSVSVAPGGSVDVQCTVSSEDGFDDAVSLACGDPYTTCVFSPSSVTPPPDGTATTTLTLEPAYSSGTWPQTVRAMSHGASRYFDMQVTISADLIFVDGFESGSTSAWSGSVP